MSTIKAITPDLPEPSEVGSGVYALTTSGSLCFLVTGTERGLVIDTGFGRIDTYAAARSLTDLPLVLVNTHGHGDHIGCNDKFGAAYAHAWEEKKIRRKSKDIVFVSEGFVFDLGGRSLEVIELPGHTPGCIALFDRANRVLYAGDMVVNSPVFLQFDYSDIDVYISSMDKLLSMSDSIDCICGCHGDSPLTMDHVRKLRTLALMIKEGKAEGEDVHLKSEDGEHDCKIYRHDGAAIYY